MLNVLKFTLILTTLACYVMQAVPQQPTLQDAWKVIIDPVELDDPNNIVHNQPRVKSRIQCGSLVLSDPDDFYRLFCITPAGQCLLSNASYPAYYDDESGGGGYRCYTVVKPLIDRSLYGPGDCPPPFEDITNVGCVFHYRRLFSYDNFDMARRSCKSYYLGCDLYTGPINTALSDYIIVKGGSDVWVGAKRQGPGVTVGSDYNWLDNRQITNAEWTLRSDYLNQPGDFGYNTNIPGSTPDCVILWTNPWFVIPPYKLANQWCDEYHEYLCEIQM